MNKDNKPPVCVLTGDDDGTIVLKPRLVKQSQMRHPKLVLDIRTATGEVVAVGVPMAQMAKIEEFMTYCYDWRRDQIFGIED